MNTAMWILAAGLFGFFYTAPMMMAFMFGRGIPARRFFWIFSGSCTTLSIWFFLHYSR